MNEPKLIIDYAAIAQGIARMYEQGAWKVYLLMSVIGIAMIWLSSAGAFSRRKSTRIMQSGAGILVISLFFHFVYFWSRDMLGIILSLLLTLAMLWFLLKERL